MGIADKIFGIGEKVEALVAERMSIEKVEMDQKILETEQRMMDVSDQKSSEKAKEIAGQMFEQYRVDLEKSTKEKYDEEAKSYLYDPFSMMESLGYKERIMSMSYDTLRLMSERNAVVAAIIQTRIHQVTSFSRPPRSKYDIGYEFGMRDREREPSNDDKKKMKELGKFLESTGMPSVIEEEERDSFDTFLSKYVRDSLVYDQGCFEIVSGRGNMPVAFYAIDGSTIRFATTPSILKRMAGYSEAQVSEMWKRQMMDLNQSTFNREKSADPEKIKYVQVISGRVMNTYTEREIGFGIRNPRTYLQQNKYGVGELEIMVSVVTAHLWAEEYNKRFFCLMNSICYTDFGSFEIEDLYKRKSLGLDLGHIWTGKGWVKYDVFKTGKRKKCITELKDGREIISSLDHLFLIADDFGELIWKKQSELEIGDWVLVNRFAVDVDFEEKLFYHCKKFDIVSCSEDLWEIIGWLVGDGIVVDRYEQRCGSSRVGLLYRSDTEYDIMIKHKKILESLGFNPKIGKRPMLDFPGEVLYEVTIYSEDFVDYIINVLGYKTYAKRVGGKRLPTAIFKQTNSKKKSFLRGLFSADGGWCGVPVLVSAYQDLRKDVQNLLFGLGIASRIYKKYTHLCVKDSECFCKEIGFLQKHKQRASKTTKSKKQIDNNGFSSAGCKLDRINPVWGEQIVRKAQLELNVRKSIDRTLFGYDLKTDSKLQKLANKYKLDFIVDPACYRQVQVKKLTITEEYEDMYDIEVFDDIHRFCANGIIVHNSTGSAPKGIIHFDVSGAVLPQEQLNAFRRQWHAQVAGVWNAWKTPIIATPGKLQYTNLQMGNKQMEFNTWINYLVKLLCFVPETKVSLFDGSLKRIDKIEPGDLVFSHSGNIRKVENIQIHNYKGKIICLKLRGGKVIKATEEHPFYVVPSEIGSSRINSGRRIFGDPNWIKANEIIAGQDYLIVPKPRIDIDKLNTLQIDLTKYLSEDEIIIVDKNRIKLKGNHSKTVERYIELSEDNAFVLGLLVSEGSYPGDYVTFCFNKKEIEYIKAANEFAEKFGLHLREGHQNGGTTLTMGCGVFARAFRRMFGKYSVERKIPEEILSSPLNIQKMFLSGIIAGDGAVWRYLNVSNLNYTTSSEKLIDQLEYMFILQGVYPFVGKEKNLVRTPWGLSIHGKQLEEVSMWLVGPKGDLLRNIINTINKKQHRQTIYKTESYFYVPVVETWIEDYNGKVYNMEVEGEHSYTVERFAVHNCAIYLIDPAEINFDLDRGGGMQAPMFYSVSEAKLKMSKDRGLQPLLRFLESEINKNIIWLIDPAYEFRFVGMDSRTEKDMQELRMHELQNWKTIDEVRAEDDLDPLGDEKGGDLIMNPSYITYRTQQAMQQQQASMMGGGGGPQGGGGYPGPEEEEEKGPDFGEEGPGGEKDLDQTTEQMSGERGKGEEHTGELDKILSTLKAKRAEK